MLRLFRKPLYVYFTEDQYMFCDDRPRFRHSIKIMMFVAQLKKVGHKFNPGLYEVKFMLINRRPMLVFVPLRKE